MQGGARRRGVALITVVMLLAITTVLLLALFSASQTELKSSVAYADGSAARMHANSVINLVIGQIQRATQQDTATAGIETWLSQPGMVRQIGQDGRMLRGNKLYSSRKMVADTESEIASDLPVKDWDLNKDLYVDMNEPVERFIASSASNKPKVFFPIIDPRAFSTDANKSVEGFSYSSFANGLSGPTLDGVVSPGAADVDEQRVPMPVEWLYMLKDGTLGYLDATTKKFVGADGSKASLNNPIVSRVAFWTDDESCKININTAGEGTSWGTPRLLHERDGEWARFQPMGYEYQRYPGHPATVCMSTALFPNAVMNPLTTDTTNFAKALQIKETIYDIMPKILPGGSKAGSVLVPAGRAFTPTDFKEVQNALGERLFASVDDFLLRPTVSGTGERAEIDLGVGGLWSGMERSEVIERLRFFLTPRSRAPELNPFGYPKICMWPLHRINSSDYRTVFDQTIARCASLAGKDYYFTRQNSNSQTELSGIPRNKQLFDYLMKLTSLPIPGFGTTAAATFENKYGDNNQQILLEIFDYIRSTNLYDENISEKAVGANPVIVGLPDARLTAYNSSGGLKSKTFTPMRNSTGSSYPGHGQVTPTVLPKSKTEVYRGMGRFLTISEIGLHFICCAEGTDTAGGKSAPKIVAKTPPAAAGYTPPTWQGGDWGIAKNWYSNFPPLTGKNQDPTNGFYKTKYPTKHNLEGIDGDQATHPGYKPANWNWSLNKDEPLPVNTKRVQATLLLEWFCPSTGWTLVNPDLQLEVEGLSKLTVGGKPLFRNDKIIVRPYGHISNAWGVWMRGGTISYRAFLQGRKLPSAAVFATQGSLLEDNGYKNTDSKTGFIKGSIQYNLVSDFIDVLPADLDKIKFDGGAITVKILPTSAAASPPPLQIFNFKFPAAQFPAPILATKSQDTSWGQHWNGSWWVHQPVPPPYWWSFHADGALGRKIDGTRPASKFDTTPVYGRFMSIGNEIGGYGNTPGAGHYNRGNLVIPDDTLQSLVLRHGDPRLTMGQYNVPDTEFEQHRLYGKQLLAHNIVLANWSIGPGLDQGLDKKGWRLVKDANYNFNFLPDHPYSPATGAGLQKYGDFDSGVGGQTDGAYINKPDEGNAYGSVNGTTGEQAVPYFTDAWVSWTGGPTYFSPNRQVASPGMFGSLPTGVHDAGASPGKKREPWRTLQFRPQTWSAKNGQKFHIGAPKVLKGYGAAGLPIQGIDPPDYLYMDFFSMPVVEPYSISDPGSTGGKINMNYQIVPFRHIKRATGLAAVMKSEFLTAVSFNDANVYLSRPGGAPANKGQSWFWKEDSSASGKKFWHRSINVDATLKLFDERFSSGFAFISPAQICEMYLLPEKGGAADTLAPNVWPDKIKDLLKAGAPNGILKFWEDHAITSDNLKEKPYTNIYPRLTTRSNTFQAYMRAQTIKKARSTDPEKFEIGKDALGAEYRGSAVIERYLDLNDPALDAGKNLDFATANPTSKPPLDALHRFRVISEKRFDP